MYHSRGGRRSPAGRPAWYIVRQPVMPAHPPQPLSAAPAGAFRGVTTLFTDIDDTLTVRGRVTREAFDALWRAAGAGLRVVPVTGRPAGWCDAIVRQWPVAGVVGENGGLYYRLTDRGPVRVYAQDPTTRAANRRRLEAVRDDILRQVPGCAVAADQPFRELDLAIDFCEDVPPLPRAAILRIVEIFQAHGATAKISSIHVNGWFGDFDKLAMVRRFLRDLDGDAPGAPLDACAFCGDAPNDEPMFRAFRHGFGVANVSRFLDLMAHGPAWIASRDGGAGFAEVVDALLHARRSP